MAENSLEIAENRPKLLRENPEDLPQGKAFGKSAGFTLVELIVTMVIIGIVAALAIPAYSRFVENTKVSRVIAEIRGLEKDILARMADGNPLPNSLADVGRGALRDPWGNFYQYLKIVDPDAARDNGFFVSLNSDFDLYSLGPDGLSDLDISADSSKDDVVRVGDGGWVGRGADF
jgi:general secretion pathway protein G